MHDFYDSDTDSLVSELSLDQKCQTPKTEKSSDFYNIGIQLGHKISMNDEPGIKLTSFQYAILN